MKIAVIGLYNDPNLGDRIICECVSGWMKNAYPEAQVDVIDISGTLEPVVQKEMTMGQLRLEQMKTRYRKVRSKLRRKDELYEWCQMLAESQKPFTEQIASRKYDVAVFAGGQLFMDTLALYVCEFVERFKEAGTAVFFNACGVGSMGSDRIRSRLKEHFLYDNVKLISSRDNVEELNRNYLTDGRNAVLTFDPALWTADIYGIGKTQRKNIGLGMMYCQNIPLGQQITFWCDVIKELDIQGTEWRMFCNGDMQDYTLGRYILEKTGHDVEAYLLERAVTSQELVEQIGSFSGMISFRLHSHIIAASLGIPAVAVCWDDKLRFFYRHLKQVERCLTIGHSGREVTDMLFQAMEEGTEQELIRGQKEYAKNLLLDAIEKELTNE